MDKHLSPGFASYHAQRILATPNVVTITEVALGIITLYLLGSYIVRRNSLPPGPRGLPIVGNVRDLPTERPWLFWAKHKDIYGPISSITVMGQSFIIVNELQIAIDLLDKKSAIYSDRPRLEFAGEMIGWNRQMILSQYGERFRTMRKFVKEFIGTKAAVVQYRPLQEIETRYFLARVLATPEHLADHLRLTAGAIFLRMSHGYAIDTEKPDALVNLVETAAKEFYIATSPGAWLVDQFPALQKLPNWFPGTHFKKVAAEFFEHNMEQADRPHEFVKRRMNAGTALPSFTSRMLERGLDEKDDEVVRWAANSLYGGGTDTVVASLSAFFLTMVLYPEVQKKAQKEIDTVIGTDRLPTLDDRSRLPYIEAVLKEVLRWHPIGPMGIPHRVTEDDVYNGYLIPKGAIVLPNLWMFAHDPSQYHNADEFKPERYLETDGNVPELDPHALAFGFGRRACPGQELADTNMFLTIAMSLAVFNISKAVDEKGREIEPVNEFSSGTVSHPKPYKCKVTPRSASAEELIRLVGDDHMNRPTDANDL
uniref:Cytochrome P450 monooxygenase claR n=1 Tax=Ampulloclitocybe clavipes TaxID=56467 RepID=CLAR_AMPCV